jgi:hypothetical protein
MSEPPNAAKHDRADNGEYNPSDTGTARRALQVKPDCRSGKQYRKSYKAKERPHGRGLYARWRFR